MLILIGYFIFLCTYSSKYTISLILNGTVDLSTVRVECSHDSVVKIGNIRQGDFNGISNTLEIDVESIRSGNTDVKFFYDDVYDSDEDYENEPPHSVHVVNAREFKTSFHVLPFGMIWCTEYDDFNGLWTVKLLADALMIVFAATLVLSFIDKRKNGDFSYSMVTIGGLIIFLSLTAAFSVYDTISSIGYAGIMNVEKIIYDVSKMNTTFANITFIPLFLFCIALSISNIQLVRHEGFSIRNLLGIMLGIAVITGMMLMNFFGRDLYMYSEMQQIMTVVMNAAVSFVYCYLECLFFSTVFCALLSTKFRIRQPMDYIIILGCAIRKDGSPTPILRSRIDRALAFEKEQYEKLKKHAKFVPSGGQGSDEVISEAESMKRYLMEQGIPEKNILKEDKSVNTYQNMAFSKKIIEVDAGDLSKAGIAFSTTNYHVFRGYTLAKRLGMKVEGLSAKTKLYFFPNAFLREFIGLIVEQKRRHILFIILGIVFFASLYLIVNF